MPEAEFRDETHAFHAGLVISEMACRGVKARPVVREDGTYLPYVEVWLDDGRMILLRVCAPSENPLVPASVAQGDDPRVLPVCSVCGTPYTWARKFNDGAPRDFPWPTCECEDQTGVDAEDDLPDASLVANTDGIWPWSGRKPRKDDHA